MPLMAASFLVNCANKGDTYKITWENWDHSVLKTDNLKKGETPKYDGTPTRPEDEFFTYTFSGWTPSIVPVVKDATYTADYKPTLKPEYNDTCVTISIPEDAEYKTFAFNCTADNPISVDWGDGTTTVDEHTHEYANSGDYTVAIKNITSLFFYEDDYPTSGFYFVTGVYLGKDITTIPNEAFNGCYLLKNVYIREDIGINTIPSRAFSACASLTSINIPEGVTTLGEAAFGGCLSLESIKLPTALTTIDRACFTQCISLKSINLPESVTTIEGQAFAECPSLASINIPAKLEIIKEDTLYNCNALENIVVSEGNKLYDSRNNCNAVITKVDIKDEEKTIYAKDTLLLGCANTVIPEDVTSIAHLAFNFNAKLASIKIPASVKNIETSAFRGCSNLASIEIDKDNPNYYSGDANAIITKKEIVISEEKVIPINTLIHGCISTIIPDSVTSLYSYAFCGNTNLKNITIPKNVTIIGESAFTGCTSLESVNFTQDSTLTTIERAAFSGCSSLKTFLIPKSVTIIKGFAFFSCPSLTYIDLTAFDENNIPTLEIPYFVTFDDTVIYKVASEAIATAFAETFSTKFWPPLPSYYTWDK